MSAGPGSLRGLLDEPGPDLLDGIPLPTANVGPPFYRFGDQRAMPRADGMIEAPHRVVDHDLGRVVFGPGELMTYEQAVQYGVVVVDPPVAEVVEAPQRGTRRGKRRPAEDRAVDGPSEDRDA